MKREQMLEELERAAEQLHLRIVYEKLPAEVSPGGLCRVNGEYRVFVDRQLPLVDRIGVLLRAVARFPTEDVFLSPEVREAVDLKAAEVRPLEPPATGEA